MVVNIRERLAVRKQAAHGLMWRDLIQEAK
jgi:hypothetical protein